MATITELDNALQDTRPPMTKFLNKVSDSLNRVDYTNASVIGGDSYNGNFPIFFGSDFGLGKIISLEPDIGLTFSTFPPRFYKIDNVQAYNFGVGLDLHQNLIYSPAPIADYNTPIYFNLFRKLPFGQFAPSGSSIELWMAYPLGNITWTNATAQFNFQSGNPSTQFNLKDTIASRNFNGDDFSNTNQFNSNNKITFEQYTQLNSEITSFIGMVVFNSDALTPTQLTHFEDGFSVPSGVLGGISRWSTHLTLSFKPFGLLASYKPIN